MMLLLSSDGMIIPYRTGTVNNRVIDGNPAETHRSGEFCIDMQHRKMSVIASLVEGGGGD